MRGFLRDFSRCVFSRCTWEDGRSFVLAASAVACLLLGRFLQVFVFDFGTDAVFLVFDGLLELLAELLGEVRELRLVVVLRLFEGFGERLFLGLLLADILPQPFGFALHLVFIRTFLDIGVVALLVLSGLVIHLLQPVALCVWVWSFSGWPVDVINFGECPLRVFDCSDDFAILISCATETNGHALAVEPCQNTS